MHLQSSLAQQQRSQIPQQRVQWVDWAKGIGILLVVVGHTPALEQSPLFYLIYCFHIPLFFILSGVLQKPLGENVSFRESPLILPWRCCRFFPGFKYQLPVEILQARCILRNDCGVYFCFPRAGGDVRSRSFQKSISSAAASSSFWGKLDMASVCAFCCDCCCHFPLHISQDANMVETI